MADKRAADAWVKHNWHLTAFDCAGVQPFNRAFTSAGANVERAIQIGKVARGPPVVIPFLGVAIARKHAGGHAIA